MTKNQFLKTVFNLNESFFIEKGFLPNKKTFEYVKANAHGYEKIQVSCAQAGSRFYLTYGLLIRINQLEELVKPFSGVNEIHWRDGASILISTIYLKGDITNKQYIVEKEEDIVKINEDFIKLMNEKGFAWLAKYNNNIALLDEELNGDKAIYPEYIQLLMMPLYGIASAHLNNNLQYNTVVNKHKSIWEEKAKTHIEFKKNLDRIEKLVLYIEKQ